MLGSVAPTRNHCFPPPIALNHTMYTTQKKRPVLEIGNVHMIWSVVLNPWVWWWLRSHFPVVYGLRFFLHELWVSKAWNPWVVVAGKACDSLSHCEPASVCYYYYFVTDAHSPAGELQYSQGTPFIMFMGPPTFLLNPFTSAAFSWADSYVYILMLNQ